MELLVRFLVLAVMCAMAAACSAPSNGTPGATPSPTPPAAEPTSTAAASPTPPAGPSPGESPPLPPIAEDPPALALELVADGLDAPTNIVATDDGWLLVTERSGRVIAIDIDSDERATALDIRDRVRAGGEQGLLGLTLHPDWPGIGRAFVHYSDRNGDTVVAEFPVLAGDGGAPRLDSGAEEILLTVDQPYANHNGGQLAFGPDGRLWIGLGDGGSGGDPLGHGQDPGTLLGALLRLDVDEAGRAAIPADNPFADGGPGAPEVALYGLRNPWRFSFDRATGALWIADVGQNAYEEVNRLDPAEDLGANLGWAVMEASHCYADADCSTDGLVLPVSEYGRELGCSITGGHVYRGSALPDLVGWYLFADYCTGMLFGLRSDVAELTPPRIVGGTGAAVSTFGEDAAGEAYVADLRAGRVYRIVPGG